jgi:WD40 repeat protein
MIRRRLLLLASIVLVVVFALRWRAVSWPFIRPTEGEPIHILFGGGGAVYCLAFSPDGQWLVTGSSDHAVRLWTTSDWYLHATLPGHSRPILAVAFSPDGQIFASAGEDQTICLWEATSRRLLCTLRGHRSAVCSLAFSPDSEMLASAANNATDDFGEVIVWDMATHRQRIDLQATAPGDGGRPSMKAVAFSPDNQTLAVGATDWRVKLWDHCTGEVKALPGRVGLVQGVAFSPDGKLLAAAGYDAGRVRLWDTSTLTELPSLMMSQGGAWVTTTAFSPDGKLVACGGPGEEHFTGRFALWDVESRREIANIRGHRDSINAVAFSPNNQMLATVSNDGTIKIWQVAAWR